jgi:hypothetical protein
MVLPFQPEESIDPEDLRTQKEGMRLYISAWREMLDTNPSQIIKLITDANNYFSDEELGGLLSPEPASEKEEMLRYLVRLREDLESDTLRVLKWSSTVDIDDPMQDEVLERGRVRGALGFPKVEQEPEHGPPLDSRKRKTKAQKQTQKENKQRRTIQPLKEKEVMQQVGWALDRAMETM